ncbi:hypothetical protein GCM10022631_40290 [Deinococcus rubellus]
MGPLQLALISKDFFEPASGPHQGVAFYYVAGAAPDLPAEAFANLSAGGYWFEWINLDRLAETQLVPPMVRDFVPNLPGPNRPGDGVQHLVSRR